MIWHDLNYHLVKIAIVFRSEVGWYQYFEKIVNFLGSKIYDLLQIAETEKKICYK